MKIGQKVKHSRNQYGIGIVIQNKSGVTAEGRRIYLFDGEVEVLWEDGSVGTHHESKELVEVEE